MRSAVSTRTYWGQFVVGEITTPVYDLECAEKRILAEIKNKHNTMNKSNRQQVEDDLRTAISQKSGKWDAYLVLIMPRKPQRYVTPIG